MITPTTSGSSTSGAPAVVIGPLSSGPRRPLTPPPHIPALSAYTEGIARMVGGVGLTAVGVAVTPITVPVGIVRGIADFFDGMRWLAGMGAAVLNVANPKGSRRADVLIDAIFTPLEEDNPRRTGTEIAFGIPAAGWQLLRSGLDVFTARLKPDVAIDTILDAQSATRVAVTLRHLLGRSRPLGVIQKGRLRNFVVQRAAQNIESSLLIYLTLSQAGFFSAHDEGFLSVDMKRRIVFDANVRVEDLVETSTRPSSVAKWRALRDTLKTLHHELLKASFALKSRPG